MTDRLDAAAIVTAPNVKNAADPTHEAGPVFRVAHSATSGYATASDLPANCVGRQMRLLSIGANVDWGWLLKVKGAAAVDAPPTLVYGQLSATAVGHLAAGTTLLDGVPEHVYVPENAYRIVFVSSAAPAAPASFAGSLSSWQTGARK